MPEGSVPTKLPSIFTLVRVDIDTLWRDLEGEEMRWKGRVRKVYSKVG
jgi:hypothetical protein